VPQVIFCGGDGWVRSFRADRWSDGKPELLWKFDANPKESTWRLSGRGTRNNLVATPVIYEGLVYISAGQEPEHGEGGGHLWCIDPKKRGDVSPQLAVLSSDHTKIIPHRRLRAVDPQKGEVAIPNPNSAVVWHYDRFDRNGDGKFDFEERFHRSVSTVAVKDDMLFAADFSGLVHCLNAKSGKPYWVCDLFAACWGSPLIVNDRVYIGDEDGDIAILYVSRDPNQSIRPSQSTPRVEINMHSSIFTTPVFANDVLYVANKSYLFAITANIE
jgi:outer membrane protein assembly factor BamB